jgi:hypothetical protein
MARQPDDQSEEHLKWLVENRSRNQRATLELYLLINQNSDAINNNVTYAALAQELTGIAFSLWRGVFLSDLTAEVEKQLSDATIFLATLISHNAIAYPQDRTAREWTFQYYLSNARFRLTELASKPPNLIEFTDIDTPAGSAKDDWLIAQAALEKSTTRFGDILKDASGQSEPRTQGPD